MRASIAQAMPTVGSTLGRRGESCLSRLHLLRPLSTTSQVREGPKSRLKYYEHELEKSILAPINRQYASPMSRLSAETRAQSSDVGPLMNEIQRTTEDPYNLQEPEHSLHVYAHRHNTHITLTRPSRDPMISLSCGSLGFRKSHRGGYDASHQLAAYMMGKIQERGFLMDIKKLAIILRGYGPGREAFTKVLLGTEGKNIRSLVIRVTDGTRLKFGGARSRRERRLG